MVYIVMGVSGSGKTTIGQMLANRMDVPFFDADDFHPEENVHKMASRTALIDHDRIPWLNRLAEEIQKWSEKGGAVLACSALKESYRELLSGKKPENIRWIYLKGSKEVIRKRMEQRSHFMPPALLDSQFETLEEPSDAISISVSKPPDVIVEQILMKL
jgi:carbohydrate kinase (thermoresistant glucokinase family)